MPSSWSSSWLSNLMDDDDLIESNLMKRSLPKVNVKESDQEYDVEMAAPGYSKKDFKITLDNGLLTLSAEKKEEKEEKEKNYTRREFGYSSFERSFNLPENVNEEDIKARYEDGVLRLTIPKKPLPNAKAKKAIDIQ